MINKKRIAYIFWGIVTLIPIIGIIWSIASPGDFHAWQTISRQWSGKLSIWGPFVFIAIQAIQVIITPISHYTVGVIGGYIYGPYWGGLYNYIGRVIGHWCAFEIARKFGRKYIVKYVDKKTINRYDRIIAGSSKDQQVGTLQALILFLIYFLPLFPDDEVSYLVGASSMPRKIFLIANLFGHVGGAFSLAYIGSGISTKDPLFWILTFFTLLGFPIIWIAIKKKKVQEGA